MSAHIEFAVEGACDPLRQCALLLHSIPPEDRNWLLGNLTGTLVPELKRLVGELQALGIPADPAAAQTALERRGRAFDFVGQAGSAAPADRGGCTNGLQRSRARDLSELLRDEPVGLIAQVMGMCDPGDRKAVLAQLRASKRRQVNERMSCARTRGLGGNMAPRSLQALKDQLSIRLAARRDVAAPGPEAAGVAGRIMRWLRPMKVWS